MKAELFVELLHEELPFSMTAPTLQALRTGLLGLLEGVEYGEVKTWSTPRRTAVRVADVAVASPRVEKLATGPLVEYAFKDGVPTKAAIGFAKGKGLEVDQLEQVEGPKGMVIAARVVEGGDPTVERLVKGLEAVVLGIPFSKSMEWGSGGLRFGRPLHRVSALFGGQVIATNVGPIAVGNSTVGHRLADAPDFSFASSDEWQRGLVDRRVEPDVDVRRSLIQVLLDQATEQLGADPIDEPELLDEVTQLVEWPTLVVGAFDTDLLELPPKLLIQAMKVHQRYFPVHRDGELLNHFVVISNNPWGDSALIAEGNARVLRARFYDARFFLAEDRKRSLAEHGASLEKMRWIRGLGTMAHKAARLAVLSRKVADWVGADPDEAARAGLLCKADLTSQMVGEFPKLQGHMGRLYALHHGEHEAVAWAIEEHYRPAFADDEPPTSRCAVAVALADRLDALVGCFGIGLAPKGGDPQGLRRAALAIVNILAAHGLDLSLWQLFSAAFDVFAHDAAKHGAPAFDRWIECAPSRDALVTELIAFTLARQKAAEVAGGASADLVDAVLGSTHAGDVPLAVHGRVEAVRELAGSDDFLPILQTFKRVLNISRGVEGELPDSDALTCDAEADLYDEWKRAAASVEQALFQHDYDLALAEMLALREPVDKFFDAVLVESSDPRERAARKGLLLGISQVFLQVADFSRITTR